MRGLTGSPRRLVQLVAPEVGRFVARASVASPPVIELETPRRLANSRAVNTAEGGPGGKQRQTPARAPFARVGRPLVHGLSPIRLFLIK